MTARKKAAKKPEVEIRPEFAHHVHDDAQEMLIQAVRESATHTKNFFEDWKDDIDPRCLAIAGTKLEEMAMWLNKGISLGGKL
jgi:hypothetical protein